MQPSPVTPGGRSAVCRNVSAATRAKRLAKRVVYLEDGRVCADAPVEAFFAGNGAPAGAAFLHGELRW